jgi:outer membrane protein TolC
MKKLIITITCGLVLSGLAAQNAPLTLAQALDTALANRVELKAQSLEMRIAEAQDAKIRASWMPQLTANGDFRYNPVLQQSAIPIGQFGGINPPSDETRLVAFGTPFQNSVSLNAEQKIFDADKKVDRQLNAVGLEQQRNTLEQRRIDVRYAVTEAYYAALFQKEKVALATQKRARERVNLDNSKERFQNGVLLQNDYDRVSLDLSNAELELKKAELDFQLSLDDLQYQMHSNTPITALADDLRTLKQAFPDTMADRSAERPEIRAEEIERRRNALEVDKAGARLKPELSAYGNYTLLALDADLTDYSNLGVRAALPIYDGKQARLDAEEYRLRQQINDANLERLRADVAHEIKTARKSLAQARLSLEESQRNIDLARRIYETDQFRFRQGVLLQNDLKTAELSLQTAENNYLGVVYDYLVAALNYRKAVGGWE